MLLPPEQVSLLGIFLTKGCVAASVLVSCAEASFGDTREDSGVLYVGGRGGTLFTGVQCPANILEYNAQPIPREGSYVWVSHVF